MVRRLLSTILQVGSEGRAVIVVSMALVCAGSVRAHPAFVTSAEIIVEPDGRFHGRAEFDTLAFALNDSSARIGNEPMEQLLAGPREALAAQLANARGRFLHGFRVTTSAGAGVVDTVQFPHCGRGVEVARHRASGCCRWSFPWKLPAIYQGVPGALRCGFHRCWNR